MQQSVIMDASRLHRTVIRLSHEIAERNEGMEEVVLIGVKRGGEVVALRIRDYFAKAYGQSVPCGGIDIGITRDDLVTEFFVPDATPNDLGFDVTGQTVVLWADPKKYSCLFCSTAAAGKFPCAPITWAKTRLLPIRNTCACA